MKNPNRYEYGLVQYGLEGSARTIHEAVKAAKTLAAQNQLPAYVYDRMARSGNPDLWQIVPGGEAELQSRKETQ
jgi:hypothetical protein